MDINTSILIFKALADESRLKIVNSLMQKSHYVEELSEKLSIGISTVSFHLKKLETAGLVRKEKEQYYFNYTLRREILNLPLEHFIDCGENDNSLQEKRIAGYRQKVLHTYFRRGKLIKIPVQNKKRRIVLEEIAHEFKHGKIYDESEIDTILGEINEDYCSLRRYMIDEKIMTRNNGKYRLTEDTAATYHEVLKNEKTKKGSYQMKINSERKRELIKTYKQNPPPMGVVQVKCLVTGKSFVMAGFNTPGLINRNEMGLKFRSHVNREMQSDYDKYGADKFTFEVIDLLERKEDPEYDYKEDLQTLEAMWIEKLDCLVPKGYNERKGRYK